MSQEFTNGNEVKGHSRDFLYVCGKYESKPVTLARNRLGLST